jgi:hypothetical protein
MHQPPHRHDPGPPPGGHEGGQQQREEPAPGLLSQSDPGPGPRTGRPPIWLILIVVLLLAAMIVLHLTGAVGPGSH